MEQYLKKDWVPIPYKIILKKFWEESIWGRIGVKRARLILTNKHRMCKSNIKSIFKEMKDQGYIDFQGSSIILNLKSTDIFL